MQTPPRPSFWMVRTIKTPGNPDVRNSNPFLPKPLLFLHQFFIEQYSPDDVIDSKCKECKTYLPVDSADAMVLHAVEKEYQERQNTRHEDQSCHDGQDLRVLPLQG